MQWHSRVKDSRTIDLDVECFDWPGEGESKSSLTFQLVGCAQMLTFLSLSKFVRFRHSLVKLLQMLRSIIAKATTEHISCLRSGIALNNFLLFHWQSRSLGKCSKAKIFVLTWLEEWRIHSDQLFGVALLWQDLRINMTTTGSLIHLRPILRITSKVHSEFQS